MTFDEILVQVQVLLQQTKRVSYRGLKRRFTLDDEYLEDLKEELIDAKKIATDEDGRFLVWTGASPVLSSEFQVSSSGITQESKSAIKCMVWTPPWEVSVRRGTH